VFIFLLLCDLKVVIVRSVLVDLFLSPNQQAASGEILVKVAMLRPSIQSTGNSRIVLFWARRVVL
jgi:hypothetical protein